MQDAAANFIRLALLDRQGRCVGGDSALARSAPLDDLDAVDFLARRQNLLILRRPAANGSATAPLWLRHGEADFIIGGFDTGQLRERIGALGQAFYLTERQTYLVAALIERGSLRDSAALLGWSYTAARNALAELKLKTGFNDLPLMIAHFLDLLGSPHHYDQLCSHHLFGLSERQYALARLSCSIPTRQELAARMGVSLAVVEAELKAIHLQLGIGSAAELARLIAEVRLVTAMAGPGPQHRVAPAHDLPETRLTLDGRAIAFSDYGPAGGKPVLILHSAITARAAPTRLVAALQGAGYRPLAIDRPGYGNTDVARPGTPQHSAAAGDAAAVFAALRLGKIDVISLGSGYAAVQLAQHAPTLIRHAILVNPPPAVGYTHVDRGPLGAVKRSFAKNPMIIRTMIRLLAAYASPDRMRDGMARSFRNSPPDLALLEADPQFLTDYLRATRDFAFGKVDGYVTEQSQWARGADFPVQSGLSHWRIVQAGHFFLHHPDSALAYWTARLPDTPVVRVPLAGQMLCYSHPSALVDLLDAMVAENFYDLGIQSGMDPRAQQRH